MRCLRRWTAATVEYVFRSISVVLRTSDGTAAVGDDFSPVLELVEGLEGFTYAADTDGYIRWAD